jgi:hypothetical protein
MGYVVTLHGANCYITLQQQYTCTVKFCFIYFMIVNMCNVILVISEFTVSIWNQLLQCFGSRIQVQISSLTDTYQSKINVQNDYSCEHHNRIET